MDVQTIFLDVQIKTKNWASIFFFQLDVQRFVWTSNEKKCTISETTTLVKMVVAMPITMMTTVTTTTSLTMKMVMPIKREIT